MQTWKRFLMGHSSAMCFSCWSSDLEGLSVEEKMEEDG